MAIDLLGLPVPLEEPPEDAHALHPHGLLVHTGILSTLALTEPGVTSLTAGFSVVTDAGAGVHGHGLFDHLKFIKLKGSSMTWDIFQVWSLHA